MEPTATCSVEECEGSPFTKVGLCSKHYYRLKRHGSVETVLVGNKTCTVDGCLGREYHGDGLCTLHYGRRHRANRPQCVAAECGKPSAMREFCWEHGERLKKYGSLERPETPSRRTNNLGYILVKAPGHVLVGHQGWVFEHRIVLHETIGPGVHACHWCGRSVSWDYSYPRDLDALVVDHLDEDRQNNEPDNLVPSCSPCNVARSSLHAKSQRKVSQ